MTILAYGAGGAGGAGGLTRFVFLLEAFCREKNASNAHALRAGQGLYYFPCPLHLLFWVDSKYIYDSI
jgi:hypothetical protein